jgi:hypothetical protein
MRVADDLVNEDLKKVETHFQKLLKGFGENLGQCDRDLRDEINTRIREYPVCRSIHTTNRP